MIHLKVKGISSLTDARYCAGMGVEKLEIVFDENGKSPLSHTEWKAIQAWIEGVDWVGEFQGNNLEILKEIASLSGISEWTISRELYEKLSVESINLKWVIKSETLIKGPGIVGNEMSIQPSETNSDLQIWIWGTEDLDQVLKIHQTNPEIGFVFQSGMEERPGWMDLSHLQDVLEKLEEAD
jgi:phosphoribosylanthranilate isomerase